jgi:nonsense-mediated mRNA decay protein 3
VDARTLEVWSVFCVECGKETSEEHELRDGLCSDCFLERHDPIDLPNIIDLVRCPTCGATLGKGGWKGEKTSEEAASEEAIRDDVVRAVEAAIGLVEGGRLRSIDLDIRPETKATFAVGVRSEVEVMDKVVNGSASTRVRLRNEACPVCSRRAGNYFEAVIQFRGTRERPATEEELEEAHELVVSEISRMFAASREVHLVKLEQMHGGLDFYISTQAAGAQVARGLANRFKATSTSSTTMAGRRDGRDLVRVTHAIRMSDLRRGDYVLAKGELLRVVSASDREATVEPSAGEGKRRHLAKADRASLQFVGDASSPEEAVLVSSTVSEIQVLDPVTLRTVDLSLPKGYDPSGRESVKVVRNEGELYLVD